MQSSHRKKDDSNQRPISLMMLATNILNSTINTNIIKYNCVSLYICNLI